MNAPAPAQTADKLVSVTLGLPADKHSAEVGSTASNSKVFVQIDAEAERMRSTLVRMTSNSVDELDSLVSQLQEVRTFLQSESQRIEREITNYTISG